ncbi:MAG: hypothetical protein HYS13_09680 [Planctomycetia bacterium]|nr:hypothetical protein [Planctomycetia bacterium]
MAGIPRAAKWVIGLSILGALLLGGGIVAAVALWMLPQKPREPLKVRLDTQGKYGLLATHKAAAGYAKAIDEAKKLHPGAVEATFDPANLETARSVLNEHQPRYAMVFILPEELDVNFGWQWLKLTTELDDDPFVDVRTGFITGANPDLAAALVRRIGAVAAGQKQLAGALVDNLGPNEQAQAGAFYTGRGVFMLPACDERLATRFVSHANGGFSDDHLDALDGAGIVHFGGHGHPDTVDGGLTADRCRRLKLSPCVVFNGACYTGVTDRWFEMFTPQGKIIERQTPPEKSFCLAMLQTEAAAYLAALHPDHGIPVYQEMEFMAYSGASLGDVIKHTHDGVILGAGGKLPELADLKDGQPTPPWTPADMMLKGTAARVLFGDPALVPCEAFTKPPFDVTVREEAGALKIAAALANPKLLSTYADTYHDDLAYTKLGFNDRALIVADLPAGWDKVSAVNVVHVTASGAELRHRLVGFAVERDGDARRLHVQVDVPSDAYMQSAFRVQGAKVELEAKK